MNTGKDLADQWHHFFEKLKRYKHIYGDTVVPENWQTDPQLARWVVNQRKAENKLPTEFKNKLLEIGFDFSIDDPWNKFFPALQNFAKEYGHPYVPSTDPRYSDLYNWLIYQIKNKKSLSKDRYKKLDYLGALWEHKSLREWKWFEMYHELKAFREKYGHSKVPQKWRENPRLSNWTLVQRRRFAEGKMKKDRKEKLDRLGFIWDFKTVYKNQWEEKFNALNAFKEKYGHCKVPVSYPDKQLAGWVDRQRIMRNKEKLSAERIKKLDKIGFIWDCTAIQEEIWLQRFAELKAYKAEHGDCFVPVNWKKNRQLGIWVSAQRTLEKKKKLDPEKKKKLDRLGFIWTDQTKDYQQKKYDELWQTHFERLCEYGHRYGKLQVSVKKDRSLQRWTCAQRKAYQEGTLSREKIAKLDQIGFPWDLHASYWLSKFNELKEFKAKYGHTRVPWRWKENPQLGQWVSRTRRHAYDLTQKQVEALNKIGFDWRTVKKTITPWDVMYQRLLDFKKSFGHTRVPVNWEPNRKLGKWISRIRSEKHKLLPERKKMLEAINFDWNKRRGRYRQNNLLAEPVN